MALPTSAINELHDSASLPPSISATNNQDSPSISRQPSTSSIKRVSPKGASKQTAVKTTPPRTSPATSDADDATWGANFWVTLVDPQSQTSFYACPATGQVSWDPPVGTFVLPPSAEGEWWELADESRQGLPYYYQTKTGETVWERPGGFVIPLGILQNTAVGRRLSQTTFDHYAKFLPQAAKSKISSSQQNGSPGSKHAAARNSLSTPSTPPRRHHNLGSVHIQLTPIPGSPNATDKSAPPSLASKHSVVSVSKDTLAVPKDSDSPPRRASQSSEQHRHRQSSSPDSSHRARSKSYRPQAPQSFGAAVEILSTSQSDSTPGGGAAYKSANDDSVFGSSVVGSQNDHTMSSEEELGSSPLRRARDIPPSPSRPVPDTPRNRPTVGGKGISGPILNHAATLQMSPVQNRASGRPIPVGLQSKPGSTIHGGSTLASRTYPMLPEALAHDIQHFSESEYAKNYFSTHRTGFIFKRKVPVAQLMTWQKSPLTSPLLVLNRLLQKDAVKVFKVIQHIMGDRERERPVTGVRMATEHVSMVNSFNNSTISLSTAAVSMLEEERWLLGEGLKHGELRDEIYCQLMKQLTKNPNAESVFKGWQLLCVLLVTFPPSKNFETYLESFIQQHTTKQEGRVDVMAKYCLRRLSSISIKGPRGKPPSIAEIETASDAAFNPSTFGESLDAIIRLQERNYPQQKIPIILPFLADGILALGGTRSEGIFRVPGDNDTLSQLRLRIERGYYTLDGVDDAHVLASLLKMWLRELADPLVPAELYDECVAHATDPEACVHIVERLPTVNRRVVLFVISFLQMFLDERVQSVTKMTPANMALVMAPNLLRCRSELMAVVFTNAQYEQIFVYNLLLYLQCNEVDDDYKPVHGLGAVANVPVPKKQNRNRSRRRE